MRDVLLDKRRQSEIISRYIIRRSPSELAVDLYHHATSDDLASVSLADKKLLRFVFTYPFLIGAVDGALAWVKPHSEVRRRIYLMFSILETQPEYAQLFLSQKRSPFYWLYMALVGMSAAIKLLIGLILVKVVIR
jgi:hypothetical protein